MLRFIETNIYALKQQYGLVADFYHHDSLVIDIKTGKKAITRSKIRINNVVMLPPRLLRMINDRGMDTNFNFGAYFDVANRVLLIDKSDLPNNWTFDIDKDRVVINHKSYDIVKDITIDRETAIMLHIKETKGTTRYEIFEAKYRDYLSLSQTIRLNKILVKGLSQSLSFIPTVVGFKQ